jgi:excisionase family DNA binding protein
VAEDYIPFEEALRRLELQDAQLKRLISENEIKAYRDGDRMKLKKDDVERLRSRLSGGGQTEELVFEDDDAPNEPGMATVPLSEAETMVEKTGRKPAMAAKPAARATTPAKKAAAPAEKAAAAPRRRQEGPKDIGGEPGWVKGLLAVTVAILLVGVFVAFDTVKGRPGSLSAAIPGVMPK